MTKDDILNEFPNFEENIRNLTSLDGVRYFYHITPNNAEDIINEGLFLKENRLSSTTIELPDEFYDDPISYCLGERGHGYRENASIVLLGIPEDEVDYAIEQNYSERGHWNEFDDPNFVIPSQYIIGYIDTNDFSINLNSDYILANEYDDLKL
ncbi:MAG TPA: hypothetical protein PLT65_00120 [Bacilli bacterium]|nr:hypothetical protein [Bacilli bacterium]